MEAKKLAAAKFVIQRFLATVFADEISEDLYKAMKTDDFLRNLKEVAFSLYNKELARGAKVLFEFMDGAGVDTHKTLRFEYADLFLNAGENPVLPYESFYLDREPTLYGEPVFQMREILRKQALHKDPAYREPEDHIAVEFDFLAEMNRREAAGDHSVANVRSDFGRRHMAWRTEFCAVLHSADQSGFYKALAEFTLGYLFVAHLASLPPETVFPSNPAADLASMANVLKMLPLAKESFLLRPGTIDPVPARTIPTHCYACGALCGMTAKTKDGILMSTSGLQGDIKGGGRLCIKGGNAKNHVYSAYRLKSPLIREDGRFRKASWEEALDKVVDDFKQHDPTKIGYMRGNDFANWVHEGLFDHLGCPKTTHRPMCDNANRMSNEHNLSDKRPWINYQEADYILHFGMNEVATSYGQRKTAQLRRPSTAAPNWLSWTRGAPKRQPWQPSGFPSNRPPTLPWPWPCATSSSKTDSTTKRSLPTGPPASRNSNSGSWAKTTIFPKRRAGRPASAACQPRPSNGLPWNSPRPGPKAPCPGPVWPRCPTACTPPPPCKP